MACCDLCLSDIANLPGQVSAMSMARDVTDSSAVPAQSSGSRLASETVASSGVSKGPSRRASRRALTDRALAEGAARTRSKGVKARESRMSLASNSGTSSPPIMSPGTAPAHPLSRHTLPWGVVATAQ